MSKKLTIKKVKQITTIILIIQILLKRLKILKENVTGTLGGEKIKTFSL